MGMFHSRRAKKGLRIIIVGCGKVGYTLTEQLSREDNDITVIDKNPAKIQEITNAHDVMGIVGNGASYSVLMDAGILGVDLIIAVTDSDELNLLCCMVARHISDCATIARVRTPDYSKEIGYLREKLGLTMIINPDLEAASEIARILYLPAALEINSFAHGQAEIVKIKVPKDSLLDNMTIMELGKTIASNILMCAVEREDKVYIPSGSFLIKQGDVISFVAFRKAAKEFLQSVGLETDQVKNAMIVGGGKTAYYLADQLLRMGITVKIIEQDQSRCEELSVLLPKAIIIHGDGTSEDLLNEEGLQYAESFVPLTGLDEENILLTLYARKVSEAKTITKINRSNFKNVVSELDLGSVIYPRYITSESIIAYVRAKKNSMDSNIETLYHMFNHRVEAIEFRIDTESEITDVPLMDLQLKSDLLIAFINRNGRFIFPKGQDVIKVGDTVMLVTTHTGFNDITDILR